MRLDDCDFEYYVDYITKKVHLLDLNNFGTRTLTNSISPDWQARLIEEEKLLADVIDFEWLCYGTDGIIASYKNYNFKFANYKLPYLYPPYLEIMGKRRSH